MDERVRLCRGEMWWVWLNGNSENLFQKMKIVERLAERFPGKLQQLVLKTAI